MSEAAAVRIWISRRWVLQHLWILAAINFGLVLASFGFKAYYRVILEDDFDNGSFIKYLLNQFHLGSENVLAAWYSSTLMLLTAVAAAACFVVDRQTVARHKWIGWGWLLLALIFLILSADEVGSIHERLSMIPALDVLGLESKGFALAWPIAAVVLFMLLFTAVRLKRFPKSIYWMLLGVVLLGINPLLEKFEWSMAEDQGWVAHDLMYHGEEAAELYGVLAFLAAMCTYLFGCLGQRNPIAAADPDVDHNLDVPYSWLRNSTVALLALMLGTWIWIDTTGFAFFEGDKGFPQNWYPQALALLLVGVTRVMWTSVPAEQMSAHGLLRLIPPYFWFLTVYYGIYLKGWLSKDGIEDFRVLEVVDALIFVGALVIGGYLLARAHTWFVRAGLLAWVVLLGIGLVGGYSSFVDFPEFAAMGVLLLVLVQQLGHSQQVVAVPVQGWAERERD